MKRVGGCAVVAVTLALVAACEKHPSDSSPAPVASAAAPEPVPDDQLSTPADFEETAANEITPENVDQELDKIEKEIAE